MGEGQGQPLRTAGEIKAELDALRNRVTELVRELRIAQMAAIGVTVGDIVEERGGWRESEGKMRRGLILSVDGSWARVTLLKKDGTPSQRTSTFFQWVRVDG